MTRLTNDMRLSIIRKAIAKAGITDRKFKLREDVQRWAEDVRVFALGGPEKARKLDDVIRQSKKDIESIGCGIEVSETGGAENTTFINANVGGLRVWEAFGRQLGSSNIRPCPNRITIPADHRLAIDYEKLQNALSVEETKERELTAKLKAVLNVSTVKKLLTIWPEAAELIPDLPESKTQTLPAILIEDLNKDIGLSTT